MSRRWQNWTDTEDDLLRHLSDSGSSPREIGERIGRSESAVCDRMKFLRVSRCGGHVRKHENWSEEELTALRELDGEGLLLTEIAEHLGRGRTSVAAKGRALGLWRTNPPPDADIPAEAGEHVPKHPARAFSEIERRRIRRIERLAKGLPRRRDCGGARARRQPKTTTRAAPRRLPPPG